MIDKRRSDETRRQMSEAAEHRRAWKQKYKTDRVMCYRRLMAAVVNQAIKDGAAWFFESGTGKSYCASAGIDPALCAGKAFLNNRRRS